MGQVQASGDREGAPDVRIREEYQALRTLWSEADLSELLTRLKDLSLSLSLDEAAFDQLLQLPGPHAAQGAAWFRDFSRSRPSGLADGLEFLAAAVLVSSRASAVRKMELLFDLFDLGRRTGRLRKNEVTIALKAVAVGAGRVAAGLPRPATLAQLGAAAERLAGRGAECLGPEDWARWVLETDAALQYLSAFSQPGALLLAWGPNHRGQLGLQLTPAFQRLPAPVLPLEGVRIASVASHESHTAFLSEDGRLWTCGSGFSGLLGHGCLEDCNRPRLVESLAHVRVAAVSAGARHTAVVCSEGDVYTWGAADLGQLGHGLPYRGDGRHVVCDDPTSGGTFAYMPQPAKVGGPWSEGGASVVAVSCCSYSTLALTEEGQVFSWGDNTDGQCGLGQRVPSETHVALDRHMSRTAASVVPEPTAAKSAARFRKLGCGANHGLGVDGEGDVWTWGQGMWGKLGHGDNRTLHEPKRVEALAHRVSCHAVGGQAHSLCLSSLYRLTVSSKSLERPLSPFTMLGLPAGRVDKSLAGSKTVTPPGTTLEVDAFLCGPLLSLGLPYRFEPGVSQVNTGSHPPEAVRESVVLVDRGLSQGVWLKLATTDFDFNVKMVPSGAQVPPRMGLTGDVMVAVEGAFDSEGDCLGKLCVIQLPAQDGGDRSATETAVDRALDAARLCRSGRAKACICILPPGCDAFAVQVDSVMQAGAAAMESRENTPGNMEAMPLGVVDHELGHQLYKHLSRLISARVAESPGGVPHETRGWTEGREEFSGAPLWQQESTGRVRRVPPLVDPNAMGTLVVVSEDRVAERLRAVLALNPLGVIICQQSWRPDAERTPLPSELLNRLEAPIACVTYEAGEELKRLQRSRSGSARPWVTMEVQPFGAVFAWGDATTGQLGLGGLDAHSSLTCTSNVLTNEEHIHANVPCYVAHLHEQQVTSLACGAQHSLALTDEGEVFAWGSADGLGVPLPDKTSSEVPLLVDQLEGNFAASAVFAGHNHCFAVADSCVRSAV